MSEPTESHDDGVPPDDELRQHAEGQTEGEASRDESGDEVPREHTEDPAEG